MKATETDSHSGRSPIDVVSPLNDDVGNIAREPPV